MYLRRLGLGCALYNEFYGCLLYADDILLMTHTVRAMQMMLHICDKFAHDFDSKFNNAKPMAMCIGNRYSERCATLQLANKNIT